MEGPQQSRATKLLNMNRQQLSTLLGLLTGHLGLYGHLHSIGKDINPLCRRCLNGNETVEHVLAMWMWNSGNITRSHFWRASTTLTCPSGSISMVSHRNRTSWKVIDREAQWVLKGRSASGSNDQLIRIYLSIKKRMSHLLVNWSSMFLGTHSDSSLFSFI